MELLSFAAIAVRVLTGVRAVVTRRRQASWTLL